MPTESIILLAATFLLIATLYSAVGFGGGSSYLAILTFYLTDQYLIRSNALVCNIAVVSIGSIIAWRDGSLNLKKALFYSALSIPAAFLGARFRLSDRSFFLLLALALLLSSVGLVLQSLLNQHHDEVKEKGVVKPLALGGAIGFLSGMVGIGGGIFLSPVANLLRWERAREMAGIAGFFILVNSISGLLGLASGGNLQLQPQLLFVLLGTVLVGGFVGSKIKSTKLKSKHIRLLTALLVFVVGLRLFLKFW